jgi:hypothetical protein
MCHDPTGNSASAAVPVPATEASRMVRATESVAEANGEAGPARAEDTATVASPPSSSSSSTSSPPTTAAPGSLTAIEANYGESASAGSSPAVDPSGDSAASKAGNKGARDGAGAGGRLGRGGKGIASKGAGGGNGTAAAGESVDRGSRQAEIDDADQMPFEGAKAVRGGPLLRKVRWLLFEGTRLSKCVWRAPYLDKFWTEVEPFVLEAIVLQHASTGINTLNAGTAITTIGGNEGRHLDPDTLGRCKFLTSYHLSPRGRPTLEGSDS